MPGLGPLRRAGMTARRVLAMMALLTASAGTLMLAGTIYLGAKARLAAVLIDRAYAATLSDGREHRPWPWADMRPLARLEAERLGITRTILSGATGESLAFGLGHVSGTAPPAGDGNCAVGGHRDTWASFVGDLLVGDELTVETPQTARAYRVVSIEIVQENDLSPLDPSEGSRLTLITCYPIAGLAESTQRLIVVAESLDPAQGSG